MDRIIFLNKEKYTSQEKNDLTLPRLIVSFLCDTDNRTIRRNHALS